jgi:hypothetical protein
MIPAVLAVQFAKPLVKWGAIIGGIVLLLAVYGVWCYAKGKATVKQEWDAAISRQAQESALQVIAEAKMSNEVLKDHAEDVRDAESRIEPIEREVIRYVQAPDKPCSVDPEFVRLFDELSRLPGSDTDRLSAANASAGEPAEPPATGITTTELLQAYYAAIDELMFLWLDYRALVQWERGRYAVQQAQMKEAD